MVGCCCSPGARAGDEDEDAARADPSGTGAGGGAGGKLLGASPGGLQPPKAHTMSNSSGDGGDGGGGGGGGGGGDNAPLAAAAPAAPTAPLMGSPRTSKSRGPRRSTSPGGSSDGEGDEEFFDADDTLGQPAGQWGPGSARRIGDILSAEGIVLEQRAAPAAGTGRCVIPRQDIPFDSPEAGGSLSWSANPAGQGFKLRGKNYMKDKKKFPSASPLFEVVQVLALCSDEQRLDFGDILFGQHVGEVIHGCPTAGAYTRSHFSLT